MVLVSQHGKALQVADMILKLIQIVLYVEGKEVREETPGFLFLIFNQTLYSLILQRIMQKGIKIWLFIEIFTLLLTYIYSASPEVSINYVSTTLNAFTPAQGSKGGGTVIYISGVNFSPIAGDIEVYIGNYPCNLIAEGSTVSMVSCITTAMTDPKAQKSLPITMYTANLLPVTCSIYLCQFAYQDYLTPFIFEIFPSTAVGNQQINIAGNHRITNVGDGRSPSASDLRYVLVGDLSCSTLDIIQDTISPSSDSIYCNTFLHQEAGEYNMTQRVIYGDALYSIKALKTSYFTGKAYTERIAAVFQASSVTTGGFNGHVLTLHGVGYQTNPTNLTSFKCSLGSVTCTVLSNEKGSIRIQLPVYQAGYETAGKLPADSADANTQQNPYLGSYGFRYTRYSYKNFKSLDSILNDFRARTSTQTILEDGYRTQLGYIYSETSSFTDYLRGYFFAPADGPYLFECSVDDTMVVYMSTVQGSTNPANMVLIMRVDSFMYNPDDPYHFIGRSNTVTLILKRGYYYMEVVARDYGGGNYYYVAVSMPPFDISTISTKILNSTMTSNNSISNPTWKIENVIITPTNILPEIITITVTLAQLPSGTTTYRLYYFQNSNNGLVRVNSNNISIRATASEFRGGLSGLSHFTGFGLTVELKMFDQSDAETSLSRDAVKFVYTLNYQWTRPSSYATLPYSSVASGVLIAATQPHSAGLDGGYTFNLNGVPLAVYDTVLRDESTTIRARNSLNRLQEALRAYYNAPQLQILSRNIQQLPDQLDFNILYIGVSNPQTVTISTTGMTGGSDDAITATVSTKRDYSANRPFFSAIPYEFLRIAASSPSLVIQYNNIPAICMDCYFTYQTSSPINMGAVTFKAGNIGMDITLTAANPQTLSQFAITDVYITLYGQPCNIDNGGTTDHFTCTFNTISLNGSPLPEIPAGTEPPRIHVRQFGYVGLPSVSVPVLAQAISRSNSLPGSLDNPMTISSITPSQLGINGGVIVTVVGTGFPLQINNQPTLTITDVQDILVGDIVVHSVSNTEITFSFPPQTFTQDKTIHLIYTLTYSTSTYTFTDSTNTITLMPSLDPSVTGLERQSASPIVKQNIIITGTNFETDASLMKVYLYFASNLTQKYELGILSVQSATQMTVVLGGGRTGDYYLRALVIGKGMSAPAPANQFSYEIVVNSISPASGSIGGGYTMTITGSNFATAKGTTQVFIGDTINNLCLIDQITSTQIKCTVPSLNDPGTPLNVLVTGRLIQNSRCKGTCTFTYHTTDTVYVQLSGSSSVFKAGDPATITTNGTFSAVPTVKVGENAVTLTSNSANSISFAYPALSAGRYLITVNLNGINAFPLLQTRTELIIGTPSATSGSNKGQIITVTGNGFTSIRNPSNVIYYNCSAVPIELPIISMTPVNVIFEIPSNPGLTCKVNVTMGRTFSPFDYAQSAARTPNVTITDMGSLTYQIIVSTTTTRNVNSVVARYVNSAGGITTSVYPFDWDLSSPKTYMATPKGGYLPAGTFYLDISFDTLGFADGGNTNKFVIPHTIIAGLTPPTPVTVSFGGQGTLTLSSAGFITNQIQNNEVTVCGIRTNIVSADQTGITFKIPPFVNEYTNQQYGLGKTQILTLSGIPISDTIVKTNYAFDNSTKSFYSSDSATCYTGLDFGAGTKAQISKIRYFPNPAWIRLNKIFDGAVFEGSNDNTAWTTIFEVDSKLVHTGWNSWLDANGSNKWRYVRFQHTNGASKCQIAEIEITGIILSTTTFSSTLPCDVKVNFQGENSAIFPNLITYSDAATAVITKFEPAFGPSTGGTLVKITGTNFASTFSAVSVLIDGIVCSVNSVSTTEIQCTTGMRVTPPAEGNSFVATSDGSIVILDCEPFLYMDRWSSTATWGGQVPPRDGDTVYVPQGMTLLVDQSTPFVNAIIIEGGKIVFSDEIDMTVDANYFILIGGQFRAGLPDNTYKHKLTITLHGGYYDKQLPYFGNKVLGCMNCRFNMHGIVREPTWTQITTTVEAGGSQLQLLDAVDWVAGQSIAIAATGFNHFESEQRTIATVSQDKKTITVDTPFTYRHFAATETHGGKGFVMNAEVALLTRNIVIQGDEMTDVYNHGSHLIFMGKVASGLDATLSYTEIRFCGQPKIMARYCSHFHLAGQVPNSYVRGIAVHHSHARVLTIHGTHYLTVQKNVGFLVQGHNIFIEDGIETHNIIRGNLMISTIASQTMLQSDTSPAGYWITNPLNTVINNHAAGGDFYGFWYEIKPHPDGPSATPNICPTGMQLGQSSNNVAHSQRRFGLRIFNYAAREYPCLPIADESLVDPWSGNPAIQSVFNNYLLWKNAEAGVLGEVLGYVTISNFLIIDSGESGMQFFVANLTKQFVTAEKSVIVGYSNGNAPSNPRDLAKVRGIITPRTDGFRADDITFVNFKEDMTPLQSCSKCESILFQVTGGKSSFFNNIKFDNILGNYIFWNNWRRQIFIDEDGTLTKPITTALGKPQGTSGTITPYFDHLNIPDHCYNVVNLWDNSTYCDQTITIRSLLYTNPNPNQDFVGQTARSFRLNALTDPDQPTTYDVQPMIIIKKSKDIPFSWAFPYAVGYNYHTHFQLGIDFQHLSLAPSQYWKDTEAIIIKFNYTDQRELYKIGKYYSQRLQQPLITGKLELTQLDTVSCLNGDYFHDRSNRHLYVCVSGRNKTIREWIDITAVRCQDFCPKSSPFGDRESFFRYWSNITQWPNQVLPKAGDNVTIPYAWNVILDLSPPALNYVLINGLLYFQYKDLTFQANTIWIQQGGIFIGTPTKPYTHQASIILNGNKNDAFTVLDPDASGNKMLAVTGALQIYASPPNVTWTRLGAIAAVGASTITVLDTTGWKANDQIVVGSTYSGQGEDEVFRIVSITNNVITLNGTLRFQHYGDVNPVINSAGGAIDVRAAVGLLTRNVKITRGPDVNNWGCRVQLYSYIMQFDDNSPPVAINGYAYLDGVEFNGCGQYGSSNAGLRIQKLGSIAPATTPTVITRSTIRNCNGYCVYLDKASNVTFDNNIIHNGFRYHVAVYKITNYAFLNNVMIGLKIDPNVIAQNQGTGLAPNNAAYLQYIPVNSDTDNITVRENLVQGSQDNGFVFPFTSCDRIGTYPFSGNTAGSCFAAFVANVMPGKQCIGAAGFSGYASTIGFIANPPGVHTEVRYSNMFFVDNNRGFTLRFAHEIDDNTLRFSDSYFMGYSRPNCPNCYSNSKLSYCKDAHAIRMLTTTISGQEFPFNKNISGFDVICTQQAFDAKAFLTNVTFQNYRFGANTQVPYCDSMNVFRKHDLASDATGVHNLYDSPCINCDLGALVYFSPSNPQWKSWFGGCGELDCTGSINYFIHDHTGHFTRRVNNNQLQPTQLLANNQPIGGNQTACLRVNDWNGYWCKFQELAVLEYQSIAADFNTRMVWPVYLRYDGGNWNSTTNGWREWVWIAPKEPANLRLARFWSVFRLSRVYNMTYSSQPPSDAVYQIQKRQLPDGNPNDWVIIRIYFLVPNVVLVRASTKTGGDNKYVDGFQQINGTYPSLTASTGVCGANYYDFERNVIHFVVNGKDNCKVRLTISSFVQLTLRFQVQMSNFYSNNGPANVLSKIVAFLNIDPSQIKIVSINPGSTVCRIIILPPSINDPVNTTTNATDPFTDFKVNNPRDSIQDSNDLNTINNQVNTGLRISTLNLGFNVLNISSTVRVVSTGGSFIAVCPQSFIYNQTSQMCFCDDGFIEINNVCVACEAIGNSTADTDPTNKRRCICKPSYVWSDTLRACFCAGPQSIVDINGLCFNCTNVGNGTGNVSSPNACRCRPSFVFHSASNTCRCPDPSSFILNNTCFGCTNFPNGTGLVANTSRNCECLPTYTFQNRSCLCPVGFFVSLNNTCVQCLNASCRCPTGMIFRPANSSCGCPIDNSIYINNRTCIACNSENMTGAINRNRTQCVCISNLVWLQNRCQCSARSMIIFNGSCISCNGTNFNYSGKGAVSPTECSCKNQFTWVPATRMCICGVNSMFVNNTCYNCTQFANTAASTNSAIPSCLCVNNLVFDIRIFTCGCPAANTIMRQRTCVLCTASPVNGLNRTNATTCTCSAALNLVWHSQTQTCICRPGFYANGNTCVSCQPILFATGASILGMSCACRPTFVWNQNTFTCTCGSNSVMGPIIGGNQSCINCDPFVGSSGIDPVDSSRCVCLGSLTWDSLRKICICPSINTTTFFIIAPNATCIPCNVSTDPFIVGTPIDAYNCRCANPYIWDNIRMRCVRCTDIPNAMAKINGTQLSCPCRQNFFFDVYTNLCIAIPRNACVSSNISSCIDCRNIPYVDTTSPPGPQFEAVQARDNSAILRQYNSLSLTLSRYSTFQCYCSGGFEWEATKKRCMTVFI